mmetsp:Transcript_115090/g.371974  ORF Transcript_115090/g.371974 Transcript_115090/m.371974 type:complete len:208 (-) Transcript_115090:723-1346(-)
MPRLRGPLGAEGLRADRLRPGAAAAQGQVQRRRRRDARHEPHVRVRRGLHAGRHGLGPHHLQQGVQARRHLLGDRQGVQAAQGAGAGRARREEGTGRPDRLRRAERDVQVQQRLLHQRRPRGCDLIQFNADYPGRILASIADCVLGGQVFGPRPGQGRPLGQGHQRLHRALGRGHGADRPLRALRAARGAGRADAGGAEVRMDRGEL